MATKARGKTTPAKTSAPAPESAIPPQETPVARMKMAELLSSITSIQQRVDAVFNVVNLFLRPEAMRVFKPRGEAEGSALKVDLRLSPTFGDRGFVTEVEGGLYLEIVPQTGKGDDNFARFGWNDDSRVTAKLGVPDITALLTAIRQVRVRGKAVPESMRPKSDKDRPAEEQGTRVSLFHKFEKDSTVIEYQFAGSGGFLSISKSKENRRNIKLTLQEELQFESYLTHALAAFNLVGK